MGLRTVRIKGEHPKFRVSPFVASHSQKAAGEEHGPHVARGGEHGVGRLGIDLSVM